MDHVFLLNEKHLGRLIRDYVAYYSQDRTHTGLEKSTPNVRLI